MIKMNINEVAQWFQDVGDEGVMLTTSKPHAKASYLHLEAEHMEPLVKRIIQLANKYVFGKHRRHDFLRGVVIQEGGPIDPHYHIFLRTPDNMTQEVLLKKLRQLVRRLDDEMFEFDLTEARMPFIYKKLLSTPCYKGFIHVRPTHAGSGGYLTKEMKAKYYLLQGRGFSLENDKLDLFKVFDKTPQGSTKDTSYASELPKTRRFKPVQRQMDTMAITADASVIKVVTCAFENPESAKLAHDSEQMPHSAFRQRMQSHNTRMNIKRDSAVNSYRDIAYL